MDYGVLVAPDLWSGVGCAAGAGGLGIDTKWQTFIDTRQKTPLLVAGMNAAILLVLVMFYSLNIPLNRFTAHFSR
ncbi:MAG: hypothetical protein U9N12_03365, partial [Euryarchaeota archaeon]|nr:hypothetical protein [Euryarchaeota archaeon]